MTDAAYRLMILWHCQDEEQLKTVERVESYFRDREIEYETGELVLPGWASIGNAAAQYGDESPFS